MMKAIIVYESKYGNTKRVAETIADGMNEVPETEVVLTEFNNVDLTNIGEFDAILIGSPNHFGSATRSIKKFIDSLGKLNLENKWGAVFDTYIAKWSGDYEKAVKKMEKQIGEKVPGIRLVVPRLSIGVAATKGPIVEGEFHKCKEFGIKIANQLKEKT